MSASSIPSNSDDANLTDEELEALLAAARGSADRRVDPRHAFFTAVTLRAALDRETVISAFSREISRCGIGLLHLAPIFRDQTYELDMRILEVSVRRSLRPIWCRPIGDTWFVRGCRFV